MLSNDRNQSQVEIHLSDSLRSPESSERLVEETLACNEKASHSVERSEQVLAKSRRLLHDLRDKP